MAKSRPIRGTISERDYCRIAEGYARQVVAGKIPAGKLLIAACQRQLNDLKAAREKGSRFPYRWDRKRASRPCRFLERLPHIKGDLAKQKRLIELDPWQCFVLTTAYGWVHRKTRLRRFRQAYLEVARKNAKSTKGAGIGLYHLVADEEAGPEVYTLATTREQAGIVWKTGKSMVKKSPGLQRRFGVEPLAQAIVVESTDGTFQSLPGDPGDGTNPSCAIVDEYHEHKTSTGYDSLYQGMGARSQPMLWIITTAGYNRAGPCYQFRAYCEKVLMGQVPPDDSLLAIIYSPDPEDDYRDPRTWAKANPGLGSSVSYQSMADACRIAEHSPSKRTVFLTKRLNVWVSVGQAWYDVRVWDRLGEPDLEIEQFHGRRAWLGLDLANVDDVAALEVIIENRDEEGNERYVRFGKYYLPREVVEANSEGSHAHWAGWELNGWVTLTEGNVTDFSVIRQAVIELCSQFQVIAVGYDPFQATQMASELVGEGVPMVEVRQSTASFNEPMKRFEKLAKQGRIRHNGDPVFSWMLGNVTAHPNHKDEIYPRKPTPEAKIDGVIAHLIGLNRAMYQPAPVNPYEERDLVVL